MNIQHKNIAILPLDHPGVNDKQYRARRNEIALLSKQHAKAKTIPAVSYTKEENEVWEFVVSKLEKLHRVHASSVYLEAKKELGISPDRIPQLKDISEELERKANFRLAPVEGLVDARSFLSYLGERTMLCTQYIRHGSQPEYTPEPDIIHELIGHVPMFMNKEFSDFSERLGKLAWTANDEEITKLERLYWFVVEFGLVQEQEGIKAFGAGLLSSLGEIEHAFSSEVLRRPFDIDEITNTSYDYSKMQDKLFVVPSLELLSPDKTKFLLPKE